MRRAVIVMAKHPRPGQVKTRLAPTLGAGGAAGLYRAMLLDVLDSVGAIPAIERFVFVQPPDGVAWFEENSGPRYSVRPQEGDSLPERMIAAFESLFRAGFGPVVMRNSDSPTLPSARITEAFAALERDAVVVLGPDHGGGYYLVGLSAPRPDLFRGITMSTKSVLEETRRRAQLFRLRIHLLAPWLDVDTPEDLVALQEQLDPARRAERELCDRTAAFLATLATLKHASAGPGRVGQAFPDAGATPSAGGKDVAGDDPLA